METTASTTNLLRIISVIGKKHNEIAEASGENFNIFNVLGLTSAEVRLHSTLIAELLNPDGSHGMKDLFLKLFIERITKHQKQFEREYSDTMNATIMVEKWTGKINDEKSIGGFIDILIQFPEDKAIIIENKIYAGDQENQLRRYYNFNKKALLIYLTLDGKPPHGFSTQNSEDSSENIIILPLSYMLDIKNWLEDCKKEAVNRPLVRETLSQYIYVINQLTHQTRNEIMKNELINEITKNSEFIQSAEDIVMVWEACKAAIIENLESEIENIARELDMETGKDENLGLKDTSFWYYKNDSSYGIFFYFESHYSNLLVGVDSIPNHSRILTEQQVEKLRVYLSDFNTSSKLNDRNNWIWVSTCKEWENITWADMEKEFPLIIKAKTKEIAEKLEEFENVH